MANLEFLSVLKDKISEVGEKTVKKSGQIVDATKLNYSISMEETELKKKYEPHTPVVYGYCRISTKKQLEQNGLDAQESEIKEKYPSAVIIREQGSGQSKRKKFEGLLEQLQEGDTLVCVKLDRFCRSTEEGLKNINMLSNFVWKQQKILE